MLDTSRSKEAAQTLLKKSYKTVSNNRKRTRGRVVYTQTINYEVLGHAMTKTIHHRYIK